MVSRARPTDPMERSGTAGRGRTDGRTNVHVSVSTWSKSSPFECREISFGDHLVQHNTVSGVCAPHKHTRFTGRHTCVPRHRVFVLAGHITIRLFVCTRKYYIASRSVSCPAQRCAFRGMSLRCTPSATSPTYFVRQCSRSSSNTTRLVRRCVDAGMTDGLPRTRLAAILCTHLNGLFLDYK